MKKLFASISLMVMAACSVANNWFLAPDDRFNFTLNFQTLSYCTLSDDVIKNYIQPLNKRPFIEIDERKASRFCEVENINVNGFNAYIVRALYIGKYTGEYTVRRKNQVIWVSHNSLASKKDRTRIQIRSAS